MLKLEEKSYIGGTIDGDGSIHSSVKGNVCNILSTTNYDYLRIVKKMLKGYNTNIGYTKHRNENHKDLWSLNLSQKPENLIPFLDEIKDYVVLKKPRVKLLLEIIKNRNIEKNRAKLQEYNRRGKPPIGWIEPIIPKSKIYDKAYTAGLMDSEGNFELTYYKRSYRTAITITSTSLQLLDYLTYMFPYNVYIHNDNTQELRPNSRRLRRMRIPAKHHMTFIKDIEPYLILKKPQVEVFKDFKLGRKSKPECYTSMKQLNQRGTNINVQIVNNITLNNPIININPQQTLLDKYFN